MKVRITDKGYAGYTGHFGSIYFEDGVSEEISSAEAERLGCFLAIETMDGKNPSATQRMLDVHNHNAQELVKESKGESVEPQAKSEHAAAAATGQEQQALAQTPVPELDFTREQQEALADKEGMPGLRAFAQQFGVKGRSIPDVIEDLLALQGKA